MGKYSWFYSYQRFFSFSALLQTKKFYFYFFSAVSVHCCILFFFFSCVTRTESKGKYFKQVQQQKPGKDPDLSSPTILIKVGLQDVLYQYSKNKVSTAGIKRIFCLATLACQTAHIAEENESTVSWLGFTISCVGWCQFFVTCQVQTESGSSKQNQGIVLHLPHSVICQKSCCRKKTSVTLETLGQHRLTSLKRLKQNLNYFNSLDVT